MLGEMLGEQSLSGPPGNGQRTWPQPTARLLVIIFLCHLCLTYHLRLLKGGVGRHALFLVPGMRMPAKLNNAA